MHDYWLEFAKVAIAHLLAVASPGPDLAIVLRQSLARGRRAALWTSVGVGAGILLHVSYSLLGLGLLLRGSPLWFTVAKYAGAAYLAWIGVQALRSRARPADTLERSVSLDTPVSARGAFVTGFLTNALNPKATLFFIALFATVISSHTPRLIQAGYGLWMAVMTGLWFSAVAVVLTRPRVRQAYVSHGHWIDRALGVVFVGFAVSLLLAQPT